jgi:hypothetical protein
MAEDKMHFAPVLALETGDFVVIGDKVVEVDNTPRDAVDGAFAMVEGTTFSHRADNWKRVSARFSTNAMIPRFDDDFDFEAYSIDDGRVIELDRWPDEPVIYVGLAQENRFSEAAGTRHPTGVCGFYVKHSLGASHHAYISLDGKSMLDQASGDRIIKWRKAEPADFVAV